MKRVSSTTGFRRGWSCARVRINVVWQLEHRYLKWTAQLRELCNARWSRSLFLFPELRLRCGLSVGCGKDPAYHGFVTRYTEWTDHIMRFHIPQHRSSRRVNHWRVATFQPLTEIHNLSALSASARDRMNQVHAIYEIKRDVRSGRWYQTKIIQTKQADSLGLDVHFFGCLLSLKFIISCYNSSQLKKLV